MARSGAVSHDSNTARRPSTRSIVDDTVNINIWLPVERWKGVSKASVEAAGWLDIPVDEHWQTVTRMGCCHN